MKKRKSKRLSMEVNEQFALIADTHELMTLTDNDEIALEKVRSYGFEADA